MSPRQCGLFVNLAGDNGTQRRAPLKSINVSATSCGPIAHNTIKFQYKNTNDTAIQSKFIFPVNSQSCVYHLSANVAGRIIIGKVKEKEEAQKEYDQAIESGKSAVLAKESKEASDIMELELGAFGSNEEAEVTVKEVFEMKLIKNGQHFQYKFPTSMFVRYGDSITAEASQNAPTEYVLNFNILSYAGVNKIIPKPWIGNETEGNTFTFTGNRKVFEKDHDVQLDMILAENFKGVKLTENLQDLTVLDQGDRKTDKMLTLSSFLVHVPTTPISELPAKEYVFVVDCSGSMGGQRIESARKTLQLLINSLPVGSYFNIVRFGSSYESLFRQPKEYTKENKDIAMKLAGTMGADLGGTEMHACLTSVLECKRHITNYKRQIFVLTDGDISNQNETLSLVKRNAKENRCFSFGIGSGCSTALVNGLADAGMGCASFITDKTAFEWEKQENLSSICVKSLMASASQHIAAVKIIPEPKAPKEPVSMVVEATCLNVFHEGHPEKVTLELTMANNQEEHVVSKQNMDDIETIESPFEPNVLHKLAAKKIIGDMVTSNLSNPYGVDMQKEIVDLSVKEQVLSPYTALVGVADESTIVGVSQRVDVGHVNDLPFQLSQIRCIMKSNMSQCLQRDAKLCDLDMRADSLQFESLSQTGAECSSRFNSSARRVNKRSLFGSLMNSVSSAFSKLMPANKSEPDDSVLACSMDVEPCGMAFERSSSAWGDDAGEECASLSEDSEAVREYQDITNQQNPGGEWTFKVKSKHEENLFRNIEATFDDVIVQSTVYAILLLLVDFSATFDEWKLTAIKGVTFLKKNVNELQTELVKLLSESKLEVDDDLLCQLLH